MNSAGDSKAIKNTEQSQCKCLISKDTPEYDQRAETFGKDIIQPGEVAKTDSLSAQKLFTKESGLPDDVIINSVRKRFRVKTNKLLKDLKKHPGNVKYDNNGVLSIEVEFVVYKFNH